MVIDNIKLKKQFSDTCRQQEDVIKQLEGNYNQLKQDREYEKQQLLKTSEENKKLSNDNAALKEQIFLLEAEKLTLQNAFKNSILINSSTTADGNLQGTAEETNSLRKKINELLKDKEDLTTDKNRWKKYFDDISEDYLVIQKQLDDNNRELQELSVMKKDYDDTVEFCTQLEQEKDKLTKEVAELTARGKENDKKVVDLQQKHEKYKNFTIKLRLDESVLKRTLEDTKAQNLQLEKKLETTEAQIKNLKEGVQTHYELTEKYGVLTIDKEKLQGEIKNVKEENAKLKRKFCEEDSFSQGNASKKMNNTVLPNVIQDEFIKNCEAAFCDREYDDLLERIRCFGRESSLDALDDA